MNTAQYKKTGLNIFLVCMFVLFGFGLIVNHELVHKEIFSSYGIDSKISYGLSEAITTPLGNYSQCTDNCQLAHNINESVGYHLQVIYSGVMMFLCILIYYIASLYYFFKDWKHEIEDGQNKHKQNKNNNLLRIKKY